MWLSVKEGNVFDNIGLSQITLLAVLDEALLPLKKKEMV